MIKSQICDRIGSAYTITLRCFFMYLKHLFGYTLFLILLAFIPSLKAEKNVLKKALQKDSSVSLFKISDPLMRDLVLWMSCEKNKKDIPLKATFEMFARRRCWPLVNTFQARLEKKLYDKKERPAFLENFFKHNPPISVEGKLLYTDLLSRKKHTSKCTAFMRDMWRNTRMTPEQEQIVCNACKTHLRANDHEERLTFLATNRDTEGIRRLKPLLSKSVQTKAQAVIKFLTKDPKARQFYQSLPASLRQSEIVLWGYMRWLISQRQYKRIPDVFQKLPARLHDPALFYKLRILAARELLEIRQYTKAAALLKTHGFQPNQVMMYSDVQWHLGWIYLSFLENPSRAKQHFDAFLKVVKTPISLSRGYYWLGKAEEKRGHPKNARAAFQKAARYKAAFYGQLAARKLGLSITPTLSTMPKLSRKDLQYFETKSMVRAIRLLNVLGAERYGYIKMFLNTLLPHMETKAERYLILKLAADTHPSAVVDLSRTFWVQNKLPHVLKCAYPFCPLPSISRQDKAAALAIIYKETRFDPTLIGDAGERGLMQVMPLTAVEEAKMLKLKHHQDKLFEPAYNIRLGIAHFKRHQGRFKSYPLAICAYNAGSAAVAKWLQQVGHPEKVYGKHFKQKDDQFINWIEAIPYESTRGYAQRFLETLTIYRARLGLKPFVWED